MSGYCKLLSLSLSLPQEFPVILFSTLMSMGSPQLLQICLSLPTFAEKQTKLDTNSLSFCRTWKVFLPARHTSHAVPTHWFLPSVSPSFCGFFPSGVLLILALTEELVFSAQVLSPTVSSSQGFPINTTAITAMGTTPHHKDHHTAEPLPTSAQAMSHPISLVEEAPSTGQEQESGPRIGEKETYHLYNQSALYSGQSRPKGKIFQVFKGNFSESTEPYLKTTLHSPFPTLRSPFTDHPFQSQTTASSDPNGMGLARTTHSDPSPHRTSGSRREAERGAGTEAVVQEADFATTTAEPSTDPEAVSVPFKPTRYGVWDMLSKNNSWVTLNFSTNVPLFAGSGSATAAAGHSVQTSFDVSISSPAAGDPEGLTPTQHSAVTNATSPGSALSSVPATRLSSSTSTAGSTATGNFLNRLVPAGTWKPGVQGNISHVTEGDKPQHRATICLSKMDIAWIILAISVPISSCCKLIKTLFCFFFP